MRSEPGSTLTETLGLREVEIQEFCSLKSIDHIPSKFFHTSCGYNSVNVSDNIQVEKKRRKKEEKHVHIYSQNDEYTACIMVVVWYLTTFPRFDKTRQYYYDFRLVE